MKTWNEKNTELVADRSRWRHAKNKYGDAMMKQYGVDGQRGYELLLEQQDHRCKLCGVHEDDIPKNLVHEHCHKTGRIRGLVCVRCNTGLGWYEFIVGLGENTIHDYLTDLKEDIL